MKHILFVTIIATVFIFTSCQKENNATTQATVIYKATETSTEGSYEGKTTDYEVFKVKLDMDKSAFVTKAKVKGEAEASLGTWELLGDRTIKVETTKATDYFYAMPISIVLLPNKTTKPTKEFIKANELKKQ